jgi:hypothetical protein
MHSLPRPAFIFKFHQGLPQYQPEAAKEMVRLIELGYSLRAAAGGVGLSYTSAIMWAASNDEFCHQVDSAAATRVYHLETEALGTFDAVRAKITLAALRKVAPEAWNAEVNTLGADNPNRPKEIVYRVVRAPAPPVAQFPVAHAPTPGSAVTNVIDMASHPGLSRIN